MPHLWPEADQKEVMKKLTPKVARPADYWQPQPKQAQLLQLCGLLDALEGGPVQAPVCECIGYGGAAFGGKTEGLLGIGLVACLMVPGVKVGYFRRKFTELEGSDGPIERSQELYTKAGGRYNQSKHLWRFGDGDDDADDAVEDGGKGAALRFCHCQHEGDVYSYQSWAFDILMFDEATQFTWFIVDYLITRNRISKFSKIPHPFRVMTANPGGVGHNWYRQIFGIGDESGT
jgi:hypothetical protein